jgi:RNA polymerase sigma-70 factor (ECF subfamily)
MSGTGPDFRDLMQRIRRGSDDAAWELVERYGDDIRRAVRRLLNHKLRSKFDSLDFVQVVWASFFRARGRLEEFETPQALAAFLITMTRNKVVMEHRRRLQTEKYNVNRETELDDSPEDSPREISRDEPAPVSVAIARERLNRMLADQPQHYRRIIQLRLEGYSQVEIAAKLGLAESTVRRFLKRLFEDAER